jgi:hypothetical protein
MCSSIDEFATCSADMELGRFGQKSGVNRGKVMRHETCDSKDLKTEFNLLDRVYAVIYLFELEIV